VRPIGECFGTFPEVFRWLENRDQRRDTVRKTVMPNKELAKRFGVKLRYGTPDITWQKLPQAMLKLLIAIAKAEQSERLEEPSEGDSAHDRGSGTGE
jgi:hypothetical protein